MLSEFGPLMGAMALLAGASGFFSCSEAALFSLPPEDRRKLKQGNAAQQLADQLLSRPEQLLSAILFWNLIINILYFALASIIGIGLQRENRSTDAALFSVISLMALIVMSEMLPKTIAVILPRVMASLVSFPLAVAVRTMAPVVPLFSAVDGALRRLFFPKFKAEPYLELSDLERAIELSTDNEELAAQERTALQNIVSLTELRAEELMRPRRQFQAFCPPVSLADLGGKITRSGYLLVTEPESEEVVSAIALKNLPTVPKQHLERFAEPVVYVPWCSSVAAVLDELQEQHREIAAIVNELGETVGIVTLEDILETVFLDQASRSSRLLERTSILQTEENLWHVTGMTSLRRLAKHFRVTLPTSKSTTIAGIVQEVLERLPEEEDTIDWGGFRLRVLQTTLQGSLIVELQKTGFDGARQ